MAKPLGSEILGTSAVRIDEGLLFIKVAMENGASKETALADLLLIDDCLTMRRMMETIGKRKDCVLTPTGRVRKNSNYMGFISNRLDQELKESERK